LNIGRKVQQVQKRVYDWPKKVEKHAVCGVFCPKWGWNDTIKK
jgi:hypothetical protein